MTSVHPRVLVIGGTGFLGTYLLPELQRRGAELAVLTRGRSNTHLLDGLTRIVADRRRLRDAAAGIRRFAPDVIVDVVLSSGAQARELTDVARGIAGRIVAISSMDVYRAVGVLHRLEDGPLEPLPLTEESALRTRAETYPPARIAMLQQVFGWLDDAYDKIPVERAILGDEGIAGTVLRLPMVYGPGDPLRRFWPLVRRMDDRRPAIIMDARVADWRSPRGYVENVATAIALATLSDRAANRVYNVGEARAHSEVEWGLRVGDAADWHGELLVMPADQVPPHLRVPGNFDQHWVVDSSRIRQELGYTDAVGTDEAIRRTIAWERANPPASPPGPLDYAAEDAAISALGVTEPRPSPRDDAGPRREER